MSASGCGSDGPESKADIKAALVKTLRGEDRGGGFDAELADCWADIIIEEVGVERLREVDLSSKEPPQDVKDKIASAESRFTECDPSATNDTTDTTAATDTTSG